MADVLTTAENTQTEVAAATEPVVEPKGEPQPHQNEQKGQKPGKSLVDTVVEDKEPETGKDTDDAEEPKGAPEKYEFKQPEGQTIDEGVLGAFSEVARELNLTQESAQKVLDKVAPAMKQAHVSQVDAWTAESKADKVIGGEKLKASLAAANKAIDTLGTPALRDLLNATGLGSNREVLSFLRQVGTQLTEEGFVAGDASSSKTQGPKDFAGLAETLYGDKP